MEIIFAFFPLIIFPVVGIIFYTTYKKSQTLFSEEQGKQLLYQEKCGARLGNRKSTWPFVRVSIYKDLLVIRSIKEAIMRKTDVDKIEIDTSVAGGALGKGIRIYHHRTDIPDPIVIYSSNSSYLKSKLDEFIV